MTSFCHRRTVVVPTSPFFEEVIARLAVNLVGGADVADAGCRIDGNGQPGWLPPRA